MKRIFFLGILLSICILILPTIEATKDITIINGWTSYNERIEKNNNVYTMHLLYNVEENNIEDSILRIKRNDDELRMIVKFGECAKNEYYEYCFLNATIKHKKASIDNNGVLQPAIQVSLKEFKHLSDLSVKRSFSQRDFKKQETATVTITLENKEDEPVEKRRIEYYG